jgi:putative peptidoglycan binding protein
VPSHAASIGHAAFDGLTRANGLLFRALGRSPRDAIGLIVGLGAVGAILVNALYMQPGPHPAPIFSVKQRPVADTAIIPVVPRARSEGGQQQVPPALTPRVVSPRTETAAPPVTAPVPVPMPRPAPKDPIADLIAPTPRVTAVQRALNDYGYGPVKATGVYGPETVKAIEKFERDRKLPVTGQIGPRLLKELAVVTGKPVE